MLDVLKQVERVVGRVPTGFFDLDLLLGGGMRRSNLIVLASRPSMGRTALSANIAANAALHQGLSVLLFNFEMSRNQILQRFLSAESGVDSMRIRLGRLSNVEIRRLGEALDELSPARIWVDDEADIDGAELCGRAYRQAARTGLDLIVVDHLHLFETDPRAITALKGIASELAVPIIALASVSTDVDARESHIPTLADLPCSGALAHAADVVLFLDRLEFWDPGTDRARIADIHVAKHRGGPSGCVSLFWNPQTTRYRDLEHRPQLNP
jgi:replicative DNA helicase